MSGYERIQTERAPIKAWIRGVRVEVADREAATARVECRKDPGVLDETPMAYKDIDAVMAAQADLVETLARFQPRIVRMAGAGERPED